MKNQKRNLDDKIVRDTTKKISKKMVDKRINIDCK